MAIILQYGTDDAKLQIGTVSANPAGPDFCRIHDLTTTKLPLQAQDFVDRHDRKHIELTR